MADRDSIQTQDTLPCDSPLISIITVCWNEPPERVQFTLESIDNQSYPNTQKIIIDSKSNPTTLNALKSYIDSSTVFVSETDSGLYDAMNKGIRLARGDYVVFMNIGDRFHQRDILKEAVDMIKMDPPRGIYYGNSVRFRDGTASKISTEPPDKLKRKWLFSRTLCHQAMLISRDCFNLYGLFDLEYSLLADREWLLRVLDRGCTYRHIQLVICDFELGGACSNWRKTKQELAALQRKYFSAKERLLFSIYWFLKKSIIRIQTRNMRPPVAWTKSES